MQEIDWMALSGVNLPLAFTGQEWAFVPRAPEFGVCRKWLLRVGDWPSQNGVFGFG